MPEIPQKEIYKAVSQYLAEMGIDRNYVHQVLMDKIEARNPEKLVQDQVAKYFRKGADGWRADETVENITRCIINERIARAMKNGVQEQLDAVITTHVNNITKLLSPGNTTELDTGTASAILILHKDVIRTMLFPNALAIEIKPEENGDYTVDAIGRTESIEKIKMSMSTNPNIDMDTLSESCDLDENITTLSVTKAIVEQLLMQRAAIACGDIKRSQATPNSIALFGPDISEESETLV